MITVQNENNLKDGFNLEWPALKNYILGSLLGLPFE